MIHSNTQLTKIFRHFVCMDIKQIVHFCPKRLKNHAKKHFLAESDLYLPNVGPNLTNSFITSGVHMPILIFRVVSIYTEYGTSHILSI